MSFWGRLFGTSQATKDMISLVRDTGDALYYTDEEKAKAAAESQRLIYEWIKNSQGQNLSRRLLAVSITFTWLFSKIIGVFIVISALWFEEVARTLELSANKIEMLASDMTPAMMLVLAFYFGAPHLNSIAQAAMTRFGDRNERKNGISDRYSASEPSRKS